MKSTTAYSKVKSLYKTTTSGTERQRPEGRNDEGRWGNLYKTESHYPGAGAERTKMTDF